VNLHLGEIVYGWKMYGLVGKQGEWFVGISIAPKEGQ
jgi:hypothetical protein